MFTFLSQPLHGVLPNLCRPFFGMFSSRFITLTYFPDTGVCNLCASSEAAAARNSAKFILCILWDVLLCGNSFCCVFSQQKKSTIGVAWCLSGFCMWVTFWGRGLQNLNKLEKLACTFFLPPSKIAFTPACKPSRPCSNTLDLRRRNR